MKRPNILFLMSDEHRADMTGYEEDRYPEYAKRVAAFRERLVELGHGWNEVQIGEKAK